MVGPVCVEAERGAVVAVLVVGADAVGDADTIVLVGDGGGVFGLGLIKRPVLSVKFPTDTVMRSIIQPKSKNPKVKKNSSPVNTFPT